MFCPACGAENEDTPGFCSQCGKPLPHGEQSTPQIQPTSPQSRPDSPQGQPPSGEEMERLSAARRGDLPNYLVQAILVTIFCCLPGALLQSFSRRR